MQKTLFSLSNVKKIDSDVEKVCFIYNQLKTSSLTKITILDAFSTIYGYKCWGHLKAVTKENRPYLPFRFSVSSHVRTIVSELSQLTDIDPKIFMISVTLVELNINDVRHIYIVECNKKTFTPAISSNNNSVDSVNNILWFTESLQKPARYLAFHPLAARVERIGIILSDFIELFPELGTWLKCKFLLDNEFVLLFNFGEWWHYNDVFTRSERLTSKFEIHLRDKDKNRICYHPFYPEGENLPADLAELFAEGMDYCPVIKNIDVNLSDIEYVNECWRNWEQQMHIKKIILTVNPSQLSFYAEFLPPEKLDILDVLIDPLFDMASKVDFTREVYSWEPRYKLSCDKMVIELEPWINTTDIDTFIRVNDRIHERLKQLIKKREMITGLHYLELYKSERYDLKLFEDEGSDFSDKIT